MSGEQHDQYVLKLEASHADLLGALETILKMIPEIPHKTNEDLMRLGTIADVALRAILSAEEEK